MPTIAASAGDELLPGGHAGRTALADNHQLAFAGPHQVYGQEGLAGDVTRWYRQG